jgi:L-threonylcarbamoyladenylate synthase
MARQTLRLFVDTPDSASGQKAIAQAAAILRTGGTVAFATETVYGLGANALDPVAVARIFEAKRRPSWDPLIVHIADREMLPRVSRETSPQAQLWMDAFWPGPLTLLLPKGKAIPPEVTAGRERVGVRMPAHPVALALLRAAGIPIAAPSANLFGHVSPTTADHVFADLDGRIDAVLDAGSTELGLESTVVDTVPETPSGNCLLYRPGAISLLDLAAVWPKIEAYNSAAAAKAAMPENPATVAAVRAALPSPGVDLRHYAPRAVLTLVEHDAAQAGNLVAAVKNAGATKTGVLLPAGLLPAAALEALPENLEVFPWGDWSCPEELAQRLFLGLRTLDLKQVVRIICPLPQEQGIGIAVCDRLRKAARRS